MEKLSLLTRKQRLLVIGYSLIFPLTNITGLWFNSGLAKIGIILTFPFLGLAWIGGVYTAGITNSFLNNDIAYLIGAFIAILIQVWFVVTLWILARRGFSTFRSWLTKIF